MAIQAIRRELGLAERGEQAPRKATLEIDAATFLKEQQARLMEGAPVNRAARQNVVFQLDSYIVDIGFQQKCQDCGHQGDREEFTVDGRTKPPYICRCGSTNVSGTMQSERRELPMEVARHGMAVTAVFPNAMAPDGTLLIQKDHHQNQVPLLRIVGSTDPKVHRAAQQKPYVSPVDGKSFDTPQQLARHLADLQAKEDAKHRVEEIRPTLATVTRPEPPRDANKRFEEALARTNEPAVKDEPPQEATSQTPEDSSSAATKKGASKKASKETPSKDEAD